VIIKEIGHHKTVAYEFIALRWLDDFHAHGSMHRDALFNSTQPRLRVGR